MHGKLFLANVNINKTISKENAR